MDSGAATVPPPEHLEIARDESAILDAWRILALDSMPSDHPEKLQASETLEKSTYKLEPLHNQDGTPVLTQESENLAEKRLTHVLCFKRPSIAETSDPSPAIVSHYEFSRRFKETCQGLLDGTPKKIKFLIFSPTTIFLPLFCLLYPSDILPFSSKSVKDWTGQTFSLQVARSWRVSCQKLNMNIPTLTLTSF